jgi:hypothetical protein
VGERDVPSTACAPTAAGDSVTLCMSTLCAEVSPRSDSQSDQSTDGEEVPTRSIRLHSLVGEPVHSFVGAEVPCERV